MEGLEVSGEGGGLGRLGGEGGELRPCEGDVQLDELLEGGVVLLLCRGAEAAEQLRRQRQHGGSHLPEQLQLL